MDDAHRSPVRTEPVRGHWFDPALLALPGAQRIRGEPGNLLGDPPAVHHLTGMRPSAWGDGTMSFELPLSGWCQGPLGIVDPCVPAFLADAPLSGAIIQRLQPEQVVATTELAINYVRPIVPDGRMLTADATAVHVGGEQGLSTCQVRDGDGNLVAHGSTRCAISSMAPPEGIEGQLPIDASANGAAADPWQRDVVGYVDAEGARTTGGASSMAQWLAGGPGTPPIGVLFGFTPAMDEVVPGRAVMSMSTSPWFTIGTPTIYGGAIAALTSVAQTIAFATSSDEPGVVHANLDLHIRFVRPVFAGPGELTATSTVTHRGRRLAVATTQVHREDGKLVALASGSAAVLQDGGERLRAVLG